MYRDFRVLMFPKLICLLKETKIHQGLGNTDGCHDIFKINILDERKKRKKKPPESFDRVYSDNDTNSTIIDTPIGAQGSLMYSRSFFEIPKYLLPRYGDN